jgi:hypothetical protein
MTVRIETNKEGKQSYLLIPIRSGLPMSYLVSVLCLAGTHTRGYYSSQLPWWYYSSPNRKRVHN